MEKINTNYIEIIKDEVETFNCHVAQVGHQETDRLSTIYMETPACERFVCKWKAKMPDDNPCSDWPFTFQFTQKHQFI